MEKDRKAWKSMGKHGKAWESNEIDGKAMQSMGKHEKHKKIKRVDKREWK